MKTKKQLKRLNFNKKKLLSVITVFMVFGLMMLIRSFALGTKQIEPVDEAADFSKINSHRVNAHGIKAVTRSSCLTDIARAWSKKMAAAGYIYHNLDLDTQIKTLCGASSIYSAAENVASGATESSAYEALLQSTPHHANIHNPDYNYVGVGVFKNGGIYYVTQDFANCSANCGSGWTSPPQPQGSNKCSNLTTLSSLLDNEGFEYNYFGSSSLPGPSNLYKWYVYTKSGTAPYRTGTPTPYSDCYVIYVDDPDTADGNVQAAQVAHATAGKSYNLGAWALYRSGNGNQVMYLEFLNSAGTVLATHTTVTDHSSGWQHRIITSKVAPSGSVYLRVKLYGPVSGGLANTAAFFWDDVTLTSN